ncbi:hypothetical protein U1Q18_045839, partial [Sarracenia purpurea var. burkii]
PRNRFKTIFKTSAGPTPTNSSLCVLASETEDANVRWIAEDKDAVDEEDEFEQAAGFGVHVTQVECEIGDGGPRVLPFYRRNANSNCVFRFEEREDVYEDWTW